MAGSRRCHSCRKDRHLAKNCPSSGSAPQASRRVYTMIEAEAIGLGSIIVGCCMINGRRLCVV